jgi:hypothetical protein
MLVTVYLPRRGASLVSSAVQTADVSDQSVGQALVGAIPNATPGARQFTDRMVVNQALRAIVTIFMTMQTD